MINILKIMKRLKVGAILSLGIASTTVPISEKIAHAADLQTYVTSTTPGTDPVTPGYTPNTEISGNTVSLNPDKFVYYTTSLAICPASMWVSDNDRFGHNLSVGDIITVNDSGTSSGDHRNSIVRVTSVDDTGKLTGYEFVRQGWSDSTSNAGNSWATVTSSANANAAPPCFYVTSQEQRSATVPRTLRDVSDDRVSPKDYGATLNGSNSIADAAALQSMIDHSGKRYFEISGRWPTDSSFNSSVSSNGIWTPDHTANNDPILFNLIGATRGDNNGVLFDFKGVDPQTGKLGAASGNNDIYELLYNGGLHFESSTTGGTYYGPKYVFEYTLNTADHPNYYNSGEYDDTVVTQISGHDTGRSGQLIDLKLHLDSALTKGFDSQEQMIAFDGSFKGKNGHWNLVGGSGDMTGEPTGGGWVDTQWELDVSGTGPELNHCNETPANANCGRQGLVYVPGSTAWQFIGSYSPNTTYTVAFTENQQIGSSNRWENFYNPDQSSHIEIPWRKYNNSTSTNVQVNGIFHAYPQSGSDKIITSTQKTTDTLPLQAIDYMIINAGGSGYAAGDTLTFGNNVPTVTVSTVDSNGAITAITYSPDGPTWTSALNTITPTATSGKGTGASLNVVMLPAAFSVVDAPATGGKGYAVGDTLTLNVGTTTNIYGVDTVTSVDANGAITGYTFAPSYMAFTNDPSNSTPTITTSGNGTGASITLTSTYGKHVVPGTTPYVSDGVCCGWQVNGAGYVVGSEYPVTYTDSHGGVHTFAELTVTQTFGSGSITRYGGYYTQVQGTVSSDVSSTVSRATVGSLSGAITNVADVDLTTIDVIPSWLAQNAMVGSGYKPLDVLTLKLADGTPVGTARVNTVYAGTNGQLDGNMVDLQTTVNISHDFQGVVYASGGSGIGAKFYVHTIPTNVCGSECDALQYWQPSYAYTLGTGVYRTDSSGNSSYYTVTTAGTSSATEPTWPTSGSVTDGTVVWTYQGTSSYKISRIEAGIPFNTFYNLDGTANGITKWQWTSEDIFEEGVSYYIAPGESGYYGTGIYTNAMFTNAVLDFSGMTVTNSLASQIRMVSDIPAIDFYATGSLSDKNKAYISREKNSLGFYSLDYYDTTQTYQDPLVLLTSINETKIPGVVQIGYGDKDSNSAMFSGAYPVPQYGLTHLSGKTGTGSNDWVAAHAMSYWELASSVMKTDATTGNVYGSASDSTLVFTFDLSGSKINTTLSVAGALTVPVSIPTNPTQTLSTLQSSGYSTAGTQVWCGTCRAPGEATGAGTGRYVYLNSKGVWKTLDGIDASE